MGKTINQLTGEVTSVPSVTNNAEIEIQLAGETTTKKIKMSVLAAALAALAGGGTGVAPTIVSMRAYNFAPNTVRIVFSQSMTAVTIAGWSATKNAVAWGVSSVSGSGTTWNFVMASDAARLDALAFSYAPGSGATIGTDTELGTISASAVTNLVGFTYTWSGQLAPDHELWNSAKGIRRKASEATAWDGTADNVSISDNVVGVSARVCFKIAATAGTCLVGIQNAGTVPENVVTDTDHCWVTDGGGIGLVQAFENGSAVGPSRAGSTAEIYCLYYENATTIKYQYSIDEGVSWVTLYTSLVNPGGVNKYANMMGYTSNFGPSEIFIL